MVSVIMDICKNILDFVLKNKEIEKQKKEKISVFFEEISEVLLDTAIKLQNDEYPHGNCIIMERIANNMGQELSGFVPESELQRLISILVDSSKIEKEFALRKEPETIPEIRRASGEFKASSILLKIS